MDLICIWPDGDWAYKHDVDNGEYGWKSDDYRIMTMNEARELGYIE